MIEAQQEDDAPSTRRSLRARIEIAVIATVIITAALVSAGLFGYGLGGRGQHPADTSAEAGFARDMQTHHAQAVQMALIIRDKTTDPVLRSIAYDIATSQQQQSGQMYAWLVQWGLPQTGTAPAMAWMGAATPGGHDMSGMSGRSPSSPSPVATPQGGHAGGTMPGLATPTQIKALERATGTSAERMFLQLMIAHHQGGVQMARGLLDRSTVPEVVTLAQAIETAQGAEIEQMQELLLTKGAA